MKDKGLYQKFKVTRTDGSSEMGHKHAGCKYFVLDLTHDKHAPAGIRGYADSCREDYPALAVDLDAMFPSTPDGERMKKLGPMSTDEIRTDAAEKFEQDECVPCGGRLSSPAIVGAAFKSVVQEQGAGELSGAETAKTLDEYQKFADISLAEARAAGTDAGLALADIGMELSGIPSPALPSVDAVSKSFKMIDPAAFERSHEPSETAAEVMERQAAKIREFEESGDSRIDILLKKNHELEKVIELANRTYKLTMKDLSLAKQVKDLEDALMQHEAEDIVSGMEEAGFRLKIKELELDVDSARKKRNQAIARTVKTVKQRDAALKEIGSRRLNIGLAHAKFRRLAFRYNKLLAKHTVSS